MIPSESSSSSDQHIREDGRRIRHRVNTTNIGWRLPIELIERVRAQAEREGTRPGRLVSAILRQQIALLRQPIDNAELEARMLRARTGSRSQ